MRREAGDAGCSMSNSVAGVRGLRGDSGHDVRKDRETFGVGIHGHGE